MNYQKFSLWLTIILVTSVVSLGFSGCNRDTTHTKSEYDLSSVTSSYSKTKLLKIKAFEGKYQDSKFHKLIYPELSELVGKDLFSTLDRNLSTAGPIIREGKYIILEGCAPHSCGSDMAIVAIDTTFGILSVAILKGSECLTFSDIPDKKNYPDIIMNWPVLR